MAKFSTKAIFAEDYTDRQFAEFNSTKLKDILNLSGRNKPRFIQRHNNLQSLIKILSNRDVHRVFVLADENTNVTNVISQSRLVSFLLDVHSRYWKNKFIPVYETPVKNWNLRNLEVLHVEESDLLIRAFGK